MTSAHFLVSECISASISAGVLPITSRPCTFIFWTNRGSAVALRTSSVSRSRTGFGVLGRRQDAEPAVQREARHAGFLDRRHVGQQRTARLAGDREQFEFAALRHAFGRRRAGKHDVDVARDHVGHGRGGAAIFHLIDVSLGHELEQLHAEMLLGAEPDRRIVELSGVRLGVSDQLAHIICRHLRIGDQDQWQPW